MLKLHIGCGCDLLPDYINLDIVGEFPRDDTNRVFKRLDAFEIDRFFPANTVDEILTKYMMEHIPYSNITKLLYKFHCVLKPHSILDITVPDLSVIVRHFTRDGAWRYPGGIEQFNLAVWGVKEWETPHQSIWTPDIGTNYLEREGWFKVKKITTNFGINGGEAIRFISMNQED